MGFLRMGTTGFAAQAHGADDGSALRTILAQALLLAAGMGLVAVAAMWPLLPWLIARMHPSIALDTFSLQYLHLRLFGLPTAMLNYALAGGFIGKHDTRAALSLLLVTTLVNIVLNLLSTGIFALLASACRNWGNNDLWFAFLAFMAMRGVKLGFIAWHLRRHGAWTALPATG